MKFLRVIESPEWTAVVIPTRLLTRSLLASYPGHENLGLVFIVCTCVTFSIAFFCKIFRKHMAVQIAFQKYRTSNGRSEGYSAKYGLTQDPSYIVAIENNGFSKFREITCMSRQCVPGQVSHGLGAKLGGCLPSQKMQCFAT